MTEVQSINRSMPPPRPISPRIWSNTLSAPPVFSSDTGGRSGALLRRWCNVEPDIAQPALDHHYLTIHLGGAKRIRRTGEGKLMQVDLECGALSIVPAGSAFVWQTEGPIDFAHVYLDPHMLHRASVEEFDRDPSSLPMGDLLGFQDPLLSGLFLAMLQEASSVTIGSQAYIDSLLHALMLRLLRGYAGAPAVLRKPHTIAPARLRRVRDFVEANLTSDICLADMAAVAASSQYHFCRAFAAATGVPPYAYIIRRRVERAKILLADGIEPVATVAGQCGFRSAAQFSRMFRRVTGLAPGQYRRLR